jgi:hypothetical protein
MLLATTEVSLGTVMKALASGAVTLRVSIRPWRGEALDARETGAGEFTYRDVKGEGRRAMFLVADLNGDGFRDYLLNLERDTLTVYLSADAPPTLTGAPLAQAGIALPSRPERVLSADLDGDGREELVLIYQERFFGALGRRLRVLRFRP